MSRLVVALDPGQRCGIAVGRVSEGKLEYTGARVLPLKEAALWLAKEQAVGETKEPVYSTIIYETWRLYAQKAQALIGDDMQPSQLIGMIRLIGWLSRTPLYTVQPDQKAIAQQVGGEPLRRAKQDSSEEHDKDALDLLTLYAFDQWNYTP